MLKSFHHHKTKHSLLFLLVLVVCMSFLTGCNRHNKVSFIDNTDNIITIGNIQSFGKDETSAAASLGISSAISYINTSTIGRFYKFKVKDFNLTTDMKTAFPSFDKIKETVAMWMVPVHSDTILYLSDTVKDSLVPIIGATTTSDNLTETPAKIYQFVPNNKTLAIYSAILADKLGSKKVVSIENTTSQYSINYATTFNSVFPVYNHGNEITKAFAGNFDNSFFDDVIAYIVSNKIDTIFIPGTAQEINGLMRGLSIRGLSNIKVIIGDEGLLADEIFQGIYGQTPPTAYFISYLDPTYRDTKDASMRNYFNKIKFKNTTSRFIASLYFDSVIVYANAVNRLVSKSTNTINVASNQEFYKKINEELVKLKDIDILTSRQMSINKDGTADKSLLALKLSQASGTSLLDIDLNK